MALYGLYRGRVVNTFAPPMKGRLMVCLPAVAGAATSWSEPCRDHKSNATPPAGSAVWVMFEAGDVAHPVWMGWAG